MDTAQQFIVGILTLVILTVMVIVVLAAVRTTIPDETSTVNFNNRSTVVVMNYSQGLRLPGTATLLDCSLTVTFANNRTGGENQRIPATNFTVANCTITPKTGTGLDAMFNNTVWNITGSYTHTVGAKRKATRIIDNTTNGLVRL